MAIRASKGLHTKPVIGFSLMEGRLDAAIFDAKQGLITRGISVDMPLGALHDPVQLQSYIQQALQQLGGRGIKSVSVSVPTALLRQTEMPKLSDKDLYTALASEAERYQSFVGAEAIADFARLPNLPHQTPGTERIVFGAVRKDYLQQWLGAFQGLKLSVERVDIHINQMLRAMATSGVLDAVVQQVQLLGPNAYWGTVFRGSQNVWFVLWQGTEVVELREVNMDLGAMAGEDELTKIILENDIHDELRRTAQNHEVAVWLADGLDIGLMQSLSEKLGAPIQPCVLGPIQSPEILMPLHPTVVGAAMGTVTPFPFGMNFARLTAAKAISNTPEKTLAAPGKSNLANKLGPILLMLGISSSVFGTLVGAGLWAYLSFVAQPKATELANTLQGKQAQQTQLATQRDQLQRQYNERAALADLIHRVTVKNRLFPVLMDDLHSITPTSVWVYDLNVSNHLVVKGKSMTEGAAIKFAKQFDPLNYVAQMQVNKITEEMVGDKVVFDFELSGTTKPDVLTPPPPPIPETPTGSGKSNTMSDDAGSGGP